MKIKFVLLSLVALFTMTNANAQDEDSNFFNHLSVGATLGTPGFGLDVAMPICNYVQVRAGFTVFPKVKFDTDLDINVSDVADGSSSITSQIPSSIAVEAKTGFTNGKLLFDIYPSKHMVFHITVGAYFGTSKIVEAYNTDNQTALETIHKYNQDHPADKIGVELGDYLLEPDANGNVNAYIKTASFKPYLGIGFGRAVPKKRRIGFMCELGCQFWNSPKLYCNDTQLTEENVGGDEGGMIKTLSKVSIYPVINIRLCGRIL